MPSRDPRIDAYIAKSADFSKPILAHLRSIVHAAVPQVEETIKWGMPFFMYRNRILCSMAAFKSHCSLHFWKGKQILGNDMIGAEGMGQFGKIRSVSDIPTKKQLTGYLKKAMQLHEEIAARPPAKKARSSKLPIPVPAAFSKALGKNRKAKTAFDEMSPSHRREYLEWITEAKTEPTRDKRIAQALDWIGEGKSRNWQYQKKR